MRAPGPLDELIGPDVRTRPDSWVRYWCMMAPRILLNGAPGVGLHVHDRTYTEAEILEAAGLGVGAACEEIETWCAFRKWCDRHLFREYTRRARLNGWPTQIHKCTFRVQAIWILVRREDFRMQAP